MSKAIIHRCVIKPDRIKVLQEAGITTLRQLAIVMECNKASRLTTLAVAELFGITPENATRSLNQMAEKGLLVRERGEKVINQTTGLPAFWWRRSDELDRVLKSYQSLS